MLSVSKPCLFQETVTQIPIFVVSRMVSEGIIVKSGPTCQMSVPICVVAAWAEVSQDQRALFVYWQVPIVIWCIFYY